MDKIVNEIQKIADAQGLIFLGACDLSVEKGFDEYLRWLEGGRHGQMRFMEENLSCRHDPTRALEGSRSILVFGLKYYIDETVARDGDFRVAQYARYKDYHKVLRKKLSAISNYLKKSHEGHVFREISDSVPVLERDYALKTESGFIGKNTMFIHNTEGSMLLLGEVLTSLELKIKFDTEVSLAPSKKSCGSCKRCQVHCPTGALDEAYKIDARKCLSYWTIEHRGPIPLKYWTHLKKHIFGCDICQLVCPFNRGQSPTSMKTAYQNSYDLFEIATMSQVSYERIFGGSPMTRAKRGGLMRNALIAMYESNDQRLGEAIALLDNDSTKCKTSVIPTLVQLKNLMS